MAFKKVNRTFKTSQYYSRKGLVSVLNKFRIKLEEILKVHAKDIHFYIGYNFKNASFTNSSIGTCRIPAGVLVVFTLK